MELAFATDVDEAGGFEFLNVVREGGRRDGQGGAGLRAAQWTCGFGDALNELEAVRVGECLEDGGALGAGEADEFAGGCGLVQYRRWHAVAPFIG